MKYLIAISSCWDYEKNGNNEAMRNTWLPDVEKFYGEEWNGSGLDYKFFFGLGQGAENEECTGDFLPGGLNIRTKRHSVLLEVEDDSAHLTYKTQASLRWAHARNYDFVFRCFPDTYARVDRLMACAFRDYDFYGDFRGSLDWPGYASGGAGYWLSRKAYQQLLSEPIPRTDVLMRVEDMWVGLSLKDVKRFDDQRFRNTRDHLPSKDNDFVTAHLSYILRDAQLRAEPYDPAFMFVAHEAWKRS